MYQALYRKYRPRSFSDVVGQDHITQTLRAQVATDKLTHAYLFIGTRGTGKTTCAKILSKAVNCLRTVDGNPCNECEFCAGINDGSILDVLEIDAASNNGVDNIRELREEAVFLPASVKKRVYILDEAHMLSTGAVNALLKILEEPPGHVVFILATTELHKVPATIQSRCQKFSFRRLGTDEIAQRLINIATSEGISISEQAAQRLSMLADGSMRDGVSLLDRCATTDKIDIEHVISTLGLPTEYELLQMVKSIAQNDALTALKIIDGLYKDGKDMAALISELSGIMRDILVISLDPKSSLLSSGITPGELTDMSKTISADRLLGCLDIIKDTVSGYRYTGITKVAIEMCLIRMCDDRKTGQITAPMQREAPKPGRVQEPTQTTEAPEIQETPEMQETPKTQEQPPAQEAPQIQEANPASKPEKHKENNEAAQSDNVLSKLLGHIDDGSLLIYLSDSSQAWGEYEDGLLTIKMTNKFSAGMVKSTFMDTLNEAALKTFGKAVNVQIEVTENETNNEKKSKLDDLQAFDIVKIE